jgi:hypothetical protein
VAWGSHGGGLKVAWGWLVGAYPLPSRWLAGGLQVALWWLSLPESMPSICLLYGFGVALFGLSTRLCFCYVLPAPTVLCRWHPGEAPMCTRG